ncbi:alpha/beta fold hydrolase [Microbacterium oleivorans]|uniref:Alpha/beta hydrolase n=1 Tax=Microbacterium oleivorans TaxID=273677 RepID=A0A7D5IUD9_9MICO|nr:alpha/beta hydrolase [Microbacterium oleivorans]QLD12974.1 alpha/beta hydrolase [Microbacterium oleivorans]
MITAPASTPRLDTAWTPHRLTGDGLPFRVWSSYAYAPASEPPTPTIVLVHGLGMSHRSYRFVHAVLAPSADVHSIDLPGFAGLKKPRGDVSVARMADALAEVIGSLSQTPVVLVGHSMGAQWAVETAVRLPRRVAGVVLMGPVTDDRHRSLREQALALALDGFRETPRTNALVLADYLRTGPAWFLSQARHMRDYRIEEGVSGLAVPALFVRGSRDPVAGDRWLTRLAAHAARGEVLVVPGPGHHVERSAPRAVATGILGFVSRHGVERTP